MKNIEFSISGDGTTVLINTVSGFQPFSDNSYEIIKFLIDCLQNRFPYAYKTLEEVYGHRPDWKYLAVRRFIKCNWGNDDEVRDISICGNLNFEHVRCPLRGGDCPYEDCICHPEEENGLTKRELEIICEIAIGLSDREIATKIFLSVKTVENHRKNVLRKLSLHSKSQITAYAYKHGLIK